MMLRIERHPRGLAISSDEAPERNAHFRAVERLLEAWETDFIGGRLLAPLAVAPELLRIACETHALWDPSLLEQAKEALSRHEGQTRAKLEVAAALDDPGGVLGDMSQLLHLDSHQLEAAAAMSTPSLQGLALFDEQGTGKTAAVLAAFDFLRSARVIDRLLVVAPKSTLGFWQTECRRVLRGSCLVRILAGTRGERHRCMLRPHDVLLASYEAVTRDQSALRIVLTGREGKYMLVADESYLIKNQLAQRSRAVAGLREVCGRAIVLCGTPAPNSPIDVVHQMDVADRGVAFAGRRISEDPGTALRQVTKGLEGGIVLRRLKSEVLPELLPKSAETVYLSLSPRQRRLYDQLHEELVLEVRSLEDQVFRRRLSNYLARRVRLLQICSDPRLLDPGWAEVPGKVLALDRLLGELIRQGEKVVVWSAYTATIDRICERYAGYGVVRIDGRVRGVAERMEAVESFQTNADVRVFVGNAAAAGAGITLTAARHAIYESLSSQGAHYLQSIDRIHRRGQLRAVTSHVLVAQDTLEEIELRRLREKERTGRALLRDGSAEPEVRERFLQSLGC